MSAGRPPVAWVLNLDAENELEAGRRYSPTRHLAAIVRRQAARLAGTLVGPEDVVVTPETLAAGAARGRPGLAWSPTPGARALLERAGATPLPSPGADVLARANARPFAAAVRAPLARESFEKRVAGTLEEALALVARPAPLGWLVRRTFGAAGRGRRRLHAGRPTDAERAWLVASLRRGPLVVEPWVRVTREYTRSGWVAPEGRVVVRAPGEQEITAAGAWVRTREAAARELGPDDAALEGAARAAGEALARAGYFGPFGIDAFRHRDAAGREVLNPLSEINARFTMDWPAEELRGELAGEVERALGEGLATPRDTVSGADGGNSEAPSPMRGWNDEETGADDPAHGRLRRPRCVR